MDDPVVDILRSHGLRRSVIGNVSTQAVHHSLQAMS
jgi:hypothetical protein